MSIPANDIPRDATPERKKAIDDDMAARIKRAEKDTLPDDVPSSKAEPDLPDPDKA